MTASVPRIRGGSRSMGRDMLYVAVRVGLNQAFSWLPQGWDLFPPKVEEVYQHFEDGSILVSFREVQ